MRKSHYLLVALFLAGTGGVLEARSHHHNEGVHLASEIVGLVKNAIAPAPRTVVVTQPAPVVVTRPAPVVVTPAPVVVTPVPAASPVVIPDYGYGWWQGTWVPCYNNWYWYHGTWVWGGRGPRPVPPPWAPDFRRRPLPPPPRPVHHHHRPAPPPPRYHHHRPAPPPPRVVTPPRPVRPVGPPPRPAHHGAHPGHYRR